MLTMSLTSPMLTWLDHVMCSNDLIGTLRQDGNAPRRESALYRVVGVELILNSFHEKKVARQRKVDELPKLQETICSTF